MPVCICRIWLRGPPKFKAKRNGQRVRSVAAPSNQPFLISGNDMILSNTDCLRAAHRWRTGVRSGGGRYFRRRKRRTRLEKTSTYLSSHPSHAGGHRFESCRAHHSFSRASACSNLRPCPLPRLRLTDPVISDLILQFVGILRNTKPKPGSNSRRPPLAIYACANQLTPCLCRQFVDNRV